MNAWSKILLAVAAAAALSVARPALGNLITQPVNNGQATDSPVVTADSANFQAFLSFPNSGHFSRMVDAIFDRPFTFTLANVDRDLLRLNVLQMRMRSDLKDRLRGMRPVSSTDPGRIPRGGRVPVDPFPRPVDILPVPNPPAGVSVPDGGSTLLLLRLAFVG